VFFFVLRIPIAPPFGGAVGQIVGAVIATIGIHTDQFMLRFPRILSRGDPIGRIAGTDMLAAAQTGFYHAGIQPTDARLLTLQLPPARALLSPLPTPSKQIVLNSGPSAEQIPGSPAASALPPLQCTEHTLGDLFQYRSGKFTQTLCRPLPPLFGQPPAQKGKQNAAEGNDTVQYHPPQLRGRTIVITAGNGPYEKLQIDKGDQLKPIFPNPFPKMHGVLTSCLNSFP
jgi:hypothetical protein